MQSMTTRTRRGEFATEFQKRRMVKHVKACIICDNFDGPAEESCPLGTDQRGIFITARYLSQPPASSISPPTKSLFSQTWKLEIKESEATGLGRTWKQGMKKVATSATNPLLKAYLPFFFYSKWEVQKEIRYSKRPLNLMQLSVLLHMPTGPCKPIKASSGH